MRRRSTRFVLLAMASALVLGCGSSQDAGTEADAAVDGAAVDAAPGWTYESCCASGVIDTCKCPPPGCGLPPFIACGGMTCAPAGGACPGDAGRDAADVSAVDGPTLDDAPPGSCNALLNDGITVTVVSVAAPMPTPSGGSIVPGTYHRTAWTRYTGVGGASGTGTETDRTTAYFSGGEFQIVTSFDGGDNQYSRGTYTTTGSNITLARSCPSVATSPYVRFDANPSSIVLYDPSSQQTLTYSRK